MEPVADGAGHLEVPGVTPVEEQRLRSHDDEAAGGSIEATLSGLLDAEADRLRQAKRYERTADRPP